MAKQTKEDRKYFKSYSVEEIRSPYIEYDYLIKMVVVGDTGVGKSQLVSRFSRNDFSLQSRQTIGVEFATKTVECDEKQICCQLWDTAGEERYRALASAYYRGSVGVLLVFDVTNPRSFKNAAYWLSEIKAYSTQDCQTMLVGNKVDLKEERKVDKSTAKSFAETNRLAYIETSAKQATNVEAAFRGLVNQIYIRSIIKSNKGGSFTHGTTSKCGELKLNGVEIRQENKTLDHSVEKLKECCST